MEPRKAVIAEIGLRAILFFRSRRISLVDLPRVEFASIFRYRSSFLVPCLYPAVVPAGSSCIHVSDGVYLSLSSW